MAKVEITKVVSNARLLSFDKIAIIDVRSEKNEQIKDYDRHGYLVNINMMNTTYQFDKDEKKFYADIHDTERMDQQLEEHAQLEKDGKDTTGLYVQYLERHEYILIWPDGNLADKVLKLIKDFHL